MSYHHLTLCERGKIELMLKQGQRSEAIARELGCNASTVRREIHRNTASGGYDALVAQRRYGQRRKACRPKGRLDYKPLREAVSKLIAEEKLSPELAAGRLRMLFPDTPRMHVCHETIYTAIYNNKYLLDYLLEFLVQARPKRRKRGQGKTRRGPLIPNRVGIEQRPAMVNERSEVGHWEGDLVVGKNQDGFILTLVERVSRILHAVKLATKRPAEACHAVIHTLLDRPVSWVRTVTFDNGTEFCDHEIITQELGTQVYFATPYSAYQRGSNEQVNGLLRRYLPKGTSFKKLTQTELDQFVAAINNRPRKCLGFRTPNEVFQIHRQEHLRALRT
jgi:transposase, IS30 family